MLYLDTVIGPADAAHSHLNHTTDPAQVQRAERVVRQQVVVQVDGLCLCFVEHW